MMTWLVMFVVLGVVLTMSIGESGDNQTAQENKSLAAKSVVQSENSVMAMRAEIYAQKDRIIPVAMKFGEEQ